jgi:CRISPR-associated protein Csy2
MLTLKSLLILRYISVENANAISGFTYGFPSVSNFLGFAHVISRSLNEKYKLNTSGVAIISHNHQINAYRPEQYGDYYFSQTRNPLTNEAKTAPFNQEGKMHLCVTLIIRCNFNSDDFDANKDEFTKYVKNICLRQRIAGGLIKHIKEVEFIEIPQKEQDRLSFYNKQKKKLLPGFALTDRTDLLERHYESLKEIDNSVEKIDAWLDFCALKYQAENFNKSDETIKDKSLATWSLVSKPAGGWLVPINVGYCAISKIYKPGEVLNTRDQSVSFRFVESVYSIGEWISPHRVSDFSQLFWDYEAEPEKGWYICKNNFASEKN